MIHRRFQKGWETIINISDLMIGDILLCSSSSLSQKMYAATNSCYSHAAICIGDDFLAEATIRGMKKNSIKDILNDYDYMAVIRLKDYWTPERADNLINFIDDRIESKAEFNSSGLREFTIISGEYHKNLPKNLAQFFEGNHEPISPNKDEYFCSELVVSAYIHVGIIGDSASLLYNPKTISPGDIAKDATFGSFIGYIIRNNNCIISECDDFYEEIMDIILID